MIWLVFKHWMQEIRDDLMARWLKMKHAVLG